MARSADHDARSSDEIAFLARKYKAPLLRYFARKGVPEDALEDLTQEVFVRLAKNGLAGIRNAEGYLFTTAANVIIDRARRAQVRYEDAHDPIDALEIRSEAPSPANVFEGKEALMRLSQILLELPERTREIFLLSRLDRFTNTQLAVRYGISVGSIEKHMTKALAHLRLRYRPDE